MNRPELKEHSVLVLSGPKGCGKTRLALELAAEKGKFVVVTADVFDSIGDMALVLEGEPITVIVEESGLPTTPRSRTFLKNALMTDVAVIPLPGGETKDVRMPLYWIFCTNEVLPTNIEWQRALGLPTEFLHRVRIHPHQEETHHG